MNKDISGVLKVIGWSICAGAFIAGLIIFLLPGFGGQVPKVVRVKSGVSYLDPDWHRPYNTTILVTYSKEIGLGLMSASGLVAYIASGLWRYSFRSRRDDYFN
ncbi:MAG: hypothetical protein JST35_12975 [Armatimonadetes bacterium]|nr:hypothetical protein [Armatimonadota bacterium]